MRHVQSVLGVSERRACRTLGQPRSTQRKARVVRADEVALTDAVVSLAAKYGRYGHRRITALLRVEGWRVNAKRVERIWRREGLKVPRRQPKRGRLWLNDGSCVRLRPCWPGHVWAYDFVHPRRHPRSACARPRYRDQDTQPNGICKRFHNTLLDEFCRVAFRKKVYRSIEELQADLDEWMQHSNEARTHQGRCGFGKTPMQTFLHSRPLAREKQNNAMAAQPSRLTASIRWVPTMPDQLSVRSSRYLHTSGAMAKHAVGRHMAGIRTLFTMPLPHARLHASD